MAARPTPFENTYRHLHLIYKQKDHPIHKCGRTRRYYDQQIGMLGNRISITVNSNIARYKFLMFFSQVQFRRGTFIVKELVNFLEKCETHNPLRVMLESLEPHISRFSYEYFKEYNMEMEYNAIKDLFFNKPINLYLGCFYFITAVTNIIIRKGHIINELLKICSKFDEDLLYDFKRHDNNFIPRRDVKYWLLQKRPPGYLVVVRIIDGQIEYMKTSNRDEVKNPYRILPPNKAKDIYNMLGDCCLKMIVGERIGYKKIFLKDVISGNIYEKFAITLMEVVGVGNVEERKTLLTKISGIIPCAEMMNIKDPTEEQILKYTLEASDEGFNGVIMTSLSVKLKIATERPRYHVLPYKTIKVLFSSLVRDDNGLVYAIKCSGLKSRLVGSSRLLLLKDLDNDIRDFIIDRLRHKIIIRGAIKVSGADTFKSRLHPVYAYIGENQ